jgi:hypothetical protein
MMKKIVFTFAILFLVSVTAHPQISFTSEMENYFDDNIYNNADKVSDFVSSFTLSSAYDIESEFNNFQVYYTGNLSYFKENLFKSSNTHRIGIVNTYLLSEDDNPLNAGINYTFRNNRDDFEIFDFTQYSLYANYRHSLSPSGTLLAGTLMNGNNYKSFSFFSHYENKFFVKYAKTFATKTSIITGAELDIKTYMEDLQSSSSNKAIEQSQFYFQIAQSLAEYTGISAYALLRKNITDGTRYLTSDDFIYYEEEIFNDMYSNDGYEFNLSLKHFFSEKILMKAELAYMRRNFTNLPAADEQGYSLDVTREDNQYAAGIEFRFDLGIIIPSLTATAGWNYILNYSNDAYYKYDNQMLSVGFGWEL